MEIFANIPAPVVIGAVLVVLVVVGIMVHDLRRRARAAKQGFMFGIAVAVIAALAVLYFKFFSGH